MSAALNCGWVGAGVGVTGAKVRAEAQVWVRARVGCHNCGWVRAGVGVILGLKSGLRPRSGPSPGLGLG